MIKNAVANTRMNSSSVMRPQRPATTAVNSNSSVPGAPIPVCGMLH
jgi:hypothetical protein